MRKVIKVLPDNIFFTKKIECWLHDMALEGLVLKRLRMHCAVFEEDAPKDIEYYVAPLYENTLTDSRKERLMKEGWEVVNENIGLNIFNFYRKLLTDKILFVVLKKAEGAPEGRPESLSNSACIYDLLNNQKKKSKSLLIISAFAVILAWAFYVLALRDITYTNLHYYTKQLIIGLVGIVLTGFLLYDFIRIKALVNNLFKLESPLNSSDWEKGKRKRRAAIISKAFLTLIFLQATFIDKYGFILNSLPSAIEYYPDFIFISEIEFYDKDTKEQYTEKPHLVYNKPSDSHKLIKYPILSSAPNTIMPVHYEVMNEWTGYSGTGKKYEAYYALYYYGCLIPELNKEAYNSWKEDFHYYSYDFSQQEPQQILTDYFEDAAYYFSDEYEGYFIAMYDDKRFIYLRYSGGRTPEEVVEAIEYKLMD